MFYNLILWNNPLNSLFFVYLFLPLSLLFYYLVEELAPDSKMIIISVVFIGLIAPKQLPLIALLVAFNIFISRILMSKNRLRNAVLVAGIAANLMVWIFFGKNGEVFGYHYLLGGGVIPFLGIDTIVGCYNHRLDTSLKIKHYLYYFLFFPRLFIGPYTAMEDFLNIPPGDKNLAANLSGGVLRYLYGGFQFMFIGTRLFSVAQTLLGLDLNDITKTSSWVAAVVLGLGVYHVLAGMANMTGGVSTMFGFNVESGWRHPFVASGIIDFSRRFNGTFKDMLQRNFSIARLNKKLYRPVQAGCMVLLGIFMSLWLGFNWAFLAWGAFLTIFTLIERFYIKKLMRRRSKSLKRSYTVVVLLVSMSILAYGVSGWRPEVFAALYKFETGIINNRIIYYLTSYMFIIVAGAVLATTLPERLFIGLKKQAPRLFEAAKCVLCIALLIINTALAI